MSKNRKNKSAQPEPMNGLASLAVLLSPVAADETVEFALRILAEQPGYVEAVQADEMLSEASMLEAALTKLQDESGTRALRLLEVQKEASKLRGDLQDWKADLKTKMLLGDGVTSKRIEQGAFFTRWLESAVDAAVKQDSVASRLQADMQKLVAEGIELQKLNERASADIVAYREKSAALTKEANELLASIQ